MPSILQRILDHRKKEKKNKDEKTASRTSPSAEAPPAYSLTDENPEYADPYSFLSIFDTKFVIDDSASMSLPVAEGSLVTRWDAVANILAKLAPICTKYDEDGIDIHFVYRDDSDQGVRDKDEVLRVFKSITPNGENSPIGTRLKQIMYPYALEWEAASNEEAKSYEETVWPKPVNVIVITDGVPTDQLKYEVRVIAEMLDMTKAPEWQCGVQFVQVGDAEGASELLDDLDNGHKNWVGSGCRDIVDTQWIASDQKEYGEGLILKMVLGAVDRRVDGLRVG